MDWIKKNQTLVFVVVVFFLIYVFAIRKRGLRILGRQVLPPANGTAVNGATVNGDEGLGEGGDFVEESNYVPCQTDDDCSGGGCDSIGANDVCGGSKGCVCRYDDDATLSGGGTGGRIIRIPRGTTFQLVSPPKVLAMARKVRGRRRPRWGRRRRR